MSEESNRTESRLSGNSITITYISLRDPYESITLVMSEDVESVPMKRFWFTTWREDVLFHATPECHHLKNNVTNLRDRHQLATAHIPVDASKVGSPPRLTFCCECVSEDPFE